MQRSDEGRETDRHALFRSDPAGNHNDCTFVFAEGISGISKRRSPVISQRGSAR